MDNREDQNKVNAQAFYDMMFNRCEPRQAIEKYVGDVYIQPHSNRATPYRAKSGLVRRPTSAIQAKLLNGNNAAQRTFKSIDIAFTFWGLC